MDRTGQSTVGRRGFLSTAALAATGLLAHRQTAGFPRATESSDIRITKIEAFTVQSKRWKILGKNSHLDRHGQYANEPCIRIRTNTGMEGIGFSRVSQDKAATMIGGDPLSYYLPGRGMHSPLERQDTALWDLVGKIYDVPVWKLLGGYGPEWVPVYDGSIYFADLMPEYASQGIDRILYEVDYALKAGHRAFKIKIGRGWKWMETEAGLRRDIEVVKAIRNRVGPEIKLTVDSNNGYDYTTAIRFLEGIDDELFFVEEMFPETINEDLALKAWFRDRNMKTLVADGESARQIDYYIPYIDAGAMDVLQGDIRRFGFTDLMQLSRMTASTGIRLAPHNYGSFLGGHMLLVLGRGIPNFLMAEMDPARTDLFDVDDIEFKNGLMRVSDRPGCGVLLREKELEHVTRNWVVD